MKRSDYRLKYKKHHNINLCKDIDVHHIDWNKNNNDINNLIAVPKMVHVVIHQSGYLNREEINSLILIYNEKTRKSN